VLGLASNRRESTTHAISPEKNASTPQAIANAGRKKSKSSPLRLRRPWITRWIIA
jgi:hypothetical protein